MDGSLPRFEGLPVVLQDPEKYNSDVRSLCCFHCNCLAPALPGSVASYLSPNIPPLPILPDVRCQYGFEVFNHSQTQTSSGCILHS